MQKRKCCSTVDRHGTLDRKDVILYGLGITGNWRVPQSSDVAAVPWLALDC